MIQAIHNRRLELLQDIAKPQPEKPCLDALVFPLGYFRCHILVLLQNSLGY